MILSLDTETTGLDAWHGTKPFLVTTCDDESNQTVWEWDVDPFTREPLVEPEELVEIHKLIESCDRLVFQNATFDLKMMETLNGFRDWPWEKIHDTQISAHMLASCQPRNLTTLALVYLGINVQPYEDKIKDATNKARRIARSKKFQEEYGEWALAKEGRPDMPSAKGKSWKADMWLPRAVCLYAENYLPAWGDWEVGEEAATHPWNNLVSSYANSDSEATLHVHLKHEEILKRRGLWPIYEERIKLLKIVYNMKETGVTINRTRKNEIYDTYVDEADKARKTCIKIANNPELDNLPVNGRSGALNEVVFEQFGLESPKTTPAGGPSMDKEVIAYWLDQLDPKDSRRLFLRCLSDYRKRKTAISYMDGYERFWNPISNDKEWYVLHPSLHPTGTNTLRWSSSNPNEQNISKKEGFNLRYCFGPSPGRCWASLDYENIELRIPAYESGERELIELFECPDRPPYYGSVHLLNFSTVYPDKWEEAIRSSSEDEAGRWIKENWKSSYYQRCKNGDFAVQYGSVDRGPDDWSTADRAFGRQGSQALLKERFQKQEALNQYWIDTANDTGFVTTMPDLEVCPDQGYPLQCSRTAYDNISPTIPLNYHVQGTACWVIFRAMTKVQEYLDKINTGKPEELRWHQVMQVHDELVIDFPFRKGFQVHLRKIKSIMENCGTYIGVPLKVSCELHENNWAEGSSL